MMTSGRMVSNKKGLTWQDEVFFFDKEVGDHGSCDSRSGLMMVVISGVAKQRARKSASVSAAPGRLNRQRLTAQCCTLVKRMHQSSVISSASIIVL